MSRDPLLGGSEPLTPALVAALHNEVEPVDPKKGWVIDVCVICCRQAKWPFCEHRDLGEGWCVPVTVTPTGTGLTNVTHGRQALLRRLSDSVCRGEDE